MLRGTRWALKAMAVMAVVAPWGLWGQVQVRPAAYAGVDAAGNPTTVEAALRGMSAQAAVMFVGTVTGVRRVDGDGFASAGIVEIQFAVEKGIRGAGDGETYVLREWGGLWSAGEQRFRVGSRLLMLLHAPGAAGLSSPICGLDGAIPVTGTSGLVTEGTRAAGANAPVADLRWVAAKLARTVSAVNRSAAETTASGLRAGAHTVAGHTGVREAEPTTPVSLAAEVAKMQDASVPVAQASVETVLQMMAGWQKETADAR